MKRLRISLSLDNSAIFDLYSEYNASNKIACQLLMQYVDNLIRLSLNINLKWKKGSEMK